MGRDADSYLAEAEGYAGRKFRNAEIEARTKNAYETAICGFLEEGKLFKAYSIAITARQGNFLGQTLVNECLTRCQRSVGINRL